MPSLINGTQRTATVLTQKRKLKTADVLLILRCGEGMHGGVTRRAKLLAPEFGISTEHCREILMGHQWMHVTVPFIESSPMLRKAQRWRGYEAL